MSGISTNLRVRTERKIQRPRLHKVILINDDFTPREFVVKLLKAVFGLGEDGAYGRMMTAHRKGSAVIAVYTREIAETKAEESMDLAQHEGYPLMMTTEPEE